MAEIRDDEKRIDRGRIKTPKYVIGISSPTTFHVLGCATNKRDAGMLLKHERTKQFTCRVDCFRIVPDHSVIARD